VTSSDSGVGHGSIDARDVAAVAAQLGRPPRSIHAVAHRCPCGNPDVVATEPRLDDGTPFPTTFYLTCPRASSRIGTLEASGLMREMTERLGEDEDLAAAYSAAHEAYLEAREAIGEVPEIAGVSAGGMPDRVKCLHVLAGQSLAQGRGVNPLGDEVLDELGDWWRSGPCVDLGGRAASEASNPAVGGRAASEASDPALGGRAASEASDPALGGRAASEASDQSRPPTPPEGQPR